MTFDPDDREIDALVDRILCDRIEQEESRRVLLVATEREAVDAAAALANSGLGRVFRVLVSPMVRPGDAVLVDPWLLDPETAQAVWNGSGRIADELWPP